ncbi:SIMPL domain-containing protein [Aestuariibaculum sediminum]|uniref:SIMPL domain-containing protein n=1 Tax=Aestuariibaculum sediminum TaxID=2770637 RepID=A0A8J6Q1J9_9FLAO|nr:SIMPL domain-containing protein [Aestuariibaculum sediminum]MBD0833032.1 SIMPL domain-containing protein [Aestuariibaculum sediminum]
MILKHLLNLSIFITSVAFSQQGEKNFIDQPYIEVTGNVETEITPNEIYLNILINEDDKKGKISVEDQENEMISVLKSLSIDLDKNFSILDFDGFYNKKFLGTNEVSKAKRYELIVNNGETLAKVYDALDRIDISNISITKTSHTDIEKFKREAKLNALKIAKEKAEDYAQAINQTIGKALLIQEQASPSINTLSGYANGVVIRGASALYGSKAATIKFEDLNLKPLIISAQVMAKFILN